MSGNTTVQTFDVGRAKEASVQFIAGGELAEAVKFACLAAVSAETEMREIIKTCPETGESESKAMPVKLTLTISGRFPVPVYRQLTGISNDGLKPGVYAYGPESRGKNFVLTMALIDEFEDLKKHVAFPHCTNIRGLGLEVDNESDEYGYAEIEVVTNAVAIGGKKRFMVEAFPGEADEAVISGWAAFNPALVEAVATPPEGE